MLAAGMMVTALIIGCGTEDPWSPDPERPLNLSMVSGPADTVGYGSDVSFSWTSTGGEGEVQYEYRLGTGNWSTPSNITSKDYEDVTAGATFNVRATDAGGDTDEDSRQFWVGTQPADDTTPPTVEITSSPAEGGFIATGSNISFSWDGSDPGGDEDNVLFWYSFAGVTSDTSLHRTVTFVNVVADDTATFEVGALDQSGNAATPASVTFTIKDANILYVDDFLWVDTFQDPDKPKERDQKQFYRDVLEGYAFAEWDVAEQGLPSAGELAGYSTVIWCSDSEIGATDFTWNNPTLRSTLDTYLSGGGNLLVAGPLTLADYKLDDEGAYIPTHPGDFEYDWLGIDTSDVAAIDTTWWIGDVPYDTLVVSPDSVTSDTSWTIPWDYWWWLTWVVKDPDATLDLPDSMKIDVAKQSDQDDYAVEIMEFREDATVENEVLFKWGLWVDGEPPIYSQGYPHPYDWPVGHLTRIDGEPRTATLNFDTYSLPLAGIRQTFQAILTEFGE